MKKLNLIYSITRMIRTLKFSVQTMYNHFQQWTVKSTRRIFYNICSVGRMLIVQSTGGCMLKWVDYVRLVPVTEPMCGLRFIHCSSDGVYSTTVHDSYSVSSEILQLNHGYYH